MKAKCLFIHETQSVSFMEIPSDGRWPRSYTLEDGEAQNLFKFKGVIHGIGVYKEIVLADKASEHEVEREDAK